MAVGNFTPSYLLDIQSELLDVFSPNASTNAEFLSEYEVARTLPNLQTAKGFERLEEGVCIEQRVVFLENGASTIVHSGSTARAGEDCTTPTGLETGSGQKVIGRNLYIEASVDVKEECRDRHDFITKSAFQLKRLMKDLAIAVNNEMITVFNTNVQANQDATSTLANHAGGGNFVEMNATAMNAEGILVLDHFARMNKLGTTPLYYHGNNFIINKQLAMAQALSPEAGFANRIYGNGRHIWDPMNMTSVTTEETTFIVNPNNYYFFNVAWSGDNQEIEDHENNVWTFKMPHPTLTYSRNGVIVPMEVEMELTRHCYKRTDGRRYYEWTYFGRIYGGHGTAPVGNNTAGNAVYTGFLGVKAV